jgi:hypothetical protein
VDLSLSGWDDAAIAGALYASHVGKSWGTRDGVFLAALLEMLRLTPKLLPDRVRPFLLSPRSAVRDAPELS